MHFSGKDRKFEPLISLQDDDTDMDTTITTYNTALTGAASEIPGKNIRGKTLGSLKMFSTSVILHAIHETLVAGWANSGVHIFTC